MLELFSIEILALITNTRPAGLWSALLVHDMTSPASSPRAEKKCIDQFFFAIKYLSYFLTPSFLQQNALLVVIVDHF